MAADRSERLRWMLYASKRGQVLNLDIWFFPILKSSHGKTLKNWVQWSLVSHHHPGKFKTSHLSGWGRPENLSWPPVAINKKYNLICHAYCLMENHYHLLVEFGEKAIWPEKDTSHLSEPGKRPSQSGTRQEARLSSVEMLSRNASPLIWKDTKT